jgi:SNF2 family DNA or RNA helicase
MAKKRELSYYGEYLKGSYLTDEDCQILDIIKDMSDENRPVEELRKTIFELSDEDVARVLEEETTDFLVEKKLGELRDEQTTGVAFMYHAKRLVLGDSVGMGKTVEISGLLNLLSQEYLKQGKEFRYLFLTEKTLLDQARFELIKFTGEFVDTLWGEKKDVQKFIDRYSEELTTNIAGVHSLFNSKYFQNYISSYRDMYDCNPFDAVIIDESAVVANTATQTFKNAVFLTKDIPRVIVINATPFESNLRAFYSQITLCDGSLLPTKTDFKKQYEITDFTKTYPVFSGKYKNAEKFEKQVKYRYLARTRKKTGAVMKDCSAKVIISPLSKEQKKLLALTSMPNMVYNCPNYFYENMEINRETIPKLGSLIDYIRYEAKEEKTILVYSKYLKSQDCIAVALEELGIDYRILNGSTSREDRQTTINEFKRKDFRVLITNVQKGLNFGNCDCCIFYTYDSNPNRMVQFEGRMMRSFDIVNKKVVVLLSEGKEQKQFNEIISTKARASDLFAGSDFSCVLSLLLEDKSKWESA